jgi:hypothetical protein
MAEGEKTAEAKQETAPTQPVSDEAKDKATEADLPENVRKAIQSEVDRVRTKYVQEKKRLETELEETKKAKMSAEERALYDQQKAKADLDAERRLLNQAKLDIYASKVLSEKGYDIEALPFVQADSEEAVQERMKAFEAFLLKRERIVSDRILKAGGRSPAQTFPGQTSLYTKDQLKAMTPAQMAELMSTPEGEKRVMDSLRAR